MWNGYRSMDMEVRFGYTHDTDTLYGGQTDGRIITKVNSCDSYWGFSPYVLVNLNPLSAKELDVPMLLVSTQCIR